MQYQDLPGDIYKQVWKDLLAESGLGLDYKPLPPKVADLTFRQSTRDNLVPVHNIEPEPIQLEMHVSPRFNNPQKQKKPSFVIWIIVGVIGIVLIGVFIGGCCYCWRKYVSDEMYDAEDVIMIRRDTIRNDFDIEMT